ncbi:MAG TPA: hypothetical protein ENK48_03065 [Gammaproteobacteria bacterium]|nr:hypothetical protein [Gammaproteobacteria bacterium]
MKKCTIALFASTMLLMASAAAWGSEQETILFHLKTGLKHDDAQICVAYNEIWAALAEGFKVNVLVDADAVNTFKLDWRGRDDISDYKIPENLREALAAQFTHGELKAVPRTYGDFLNMLHDKGAEFYVNASFLVVAKIEKRMDTVEHLSAKFFRPIGLREMLALRTKADYYMVY